MTEDTLPRFIGKIILPILVVPASLVLLSYLFQVWFRFSESAWYTTLLDNDGGAYSVTYAYVAENWISLRSYKTGDDKLLAERTYQFVGPVNFTWTNTMFIYDSSDNSFYYDGHVRLPPIIIDWWLSHLL